MEIEYFDRYDGCAKVEKVYGDALIKMLYSRPDGPIIKALCHNRITSHLVGLYHDTALSRKKIDSFVANYQIQMDDFLPQEQRSNEDPYENFNQFFIRRYRPGLRPFAEGRSLPAFSEGRYFGHQSIGPDVAIPVKGEFLTAQALIARDNLSKEFIGGPLLISRLCPVDYHRFHFPDDGVVTQQYRVEGAYHSVNPMALKQVPEVFAINERQVAILETKKFGKLAYIEVGALCVGKIVQTFKGNEFKRGEEKGYFLFGASTVILLGTPGSFSIQEDILENTKKGVETYVRLGDSVGSVD